MLWFRLFVRHRSHRIYQLGFRCCHLGLRRYSRVHMRLWSHRSCHRW